MNIVDGLATCFLCAETFDLGHHYEFHIVECRRKVRKFKPMPRSEFNSIVKTFESKMREYMPGMLLGHGETV